MNDRDWTMLTWREKTWQERGGTVLLFTIATVICLGMAVGISLLGQAP